jgi:hypothetical protein
MTGAVHAGLAAATAACIAANAFIVAADLARARFVMANSAQVGLAPGSIPYLAALKGAGALGLAAGLAGIPFVGLAAAAGLVAFFVGAVGAHVRARVFYNIGFPLLYLALAAASLAYFAGS